MYEYNKTNLQSKIWFIWLFSQNSFRVCERGIESQGTWVKI